MEGQAPDFQDIDVGLLTTPVVLALVDHDENAATPPVLRLVGGGEFQ